MATIGKRHWTYKGVTKSVWQVRYFDASGSRRGRTFPNKHEAAIFHGKVGGSRGTAFEPDRDEATVSYVANAYFKWMYSRAADGRCSSGYVLEKEKGAEFYIVSRLGKMKIAELSLHILTEWHAGVKRSRGISPRTARGVAQQLKRIIAFAQRRQWVTHNPADALLEELRGIPVRRVRSFKPDEMQRLLAVVAESVSRASTPFHLRAQKMLQCYVHLGVFCGLRAGEISALDLDHVDLERRQIRVEYNMLVSGGRKAPKSEAGNRTVPIPEHLVGLLADWIEHHRPPATELARYVAPDRRRLIYLTSQGRPAHFSGMYKRWRLALDDAELTGAADSHHFHATRHFFASWLLANGGSPADTAALMGHSNAAMTLSVYAHAISPLKHATPIQAAMAGALMPPPMPLLSDMRDTPLQEGK